MIEYTLKIGDVATSSGSVEYRCFGLGSCIGLFIQDRRSGLTGGAHILLPEHEPGPDSKKYYNVHSALTELLSQFRMMGSDLSSLRAKITGGANIIGANTSAGLRNYESAINNLVANKIFVAAADVGGARSRSARFCSGTGTLIVKFSGNRESNIY